MSQLVKPRGSPVNKSVNKHHPWAVSYRWSGLKMIQIVPEKLYFELYGKHREYITLIVHTFKSSWRHETVCTQTVWFLGWKGTGRGNTRGSHFRGTGTRRFKFKSKFFIYYLIDNIRLCNWLSLRRMVPWINHLPPVCWSTFWKSSLKW